MPVTARLQHSARVDDLLAYPCLLAPCTGHRNAHTCELFSVVHLNISTRPCQYIGEQELELENRRNHGSTGERVGDAAGTQLSHFFNCDCTTSPACSCDSCILVHLQDPSVVYSDVQRQNFL